MIFKELTSPTKRFIFYAISVFIAFFFIFWKFADELIEKELHKFDLTIIDWVQSFISVKHTKLMELITFLGSFKAVIWISILTIIIMILNKKRWEALFFLIAVLGCSFFNTILKWIFHRTRPTIHPIIQETGYSFPSGHSMVSFVMYGMLTYFLVLFFEKRSAKIITIIFFSVLVLFIGLSRIYLGVHYPSDVIAGFSAGGAWLVICLMFLKIILEIRSKRRKNNLEGT